MSLYTATEILVWLLLAAACGFGLGLLVGLGRSREDAAALANATVPFAADEPVTVHPEEVAARAAAQESTPQPAPGRQPVGAGVNRAAFRGSAMPGPGGGQPSPEHTVKANIDSMTYYLPGTDTHARITADVWFRDAPSAEAAGFRPGRT